MNIQEASKATGVSRDMIRFYEKKNLIHPARDENGYRNFSMQDLMLIVMIKQYSTLGVSLRTMSTMSGHEAVSGFRSEIQKAADDLEYEMQWLNARLALMKDYIFLFSSLEKEMRIDHGWRNETTYIRNTDNAPYAYAHLPSDVPGRAVFRIKEEDLMNTSYPQDQGMLTAYNKEGERVPAHAFARITVEGQAGVFLSNAQILAYRKQVSEAGFDVSGDLYMYQITGTDNANLCLYCLEFTLQK